MVLALVKTPQHIKGAKICAGRRSVNHQGTRSACQRWILRQVLSLPPYSGRRVELYEPIDLCRLLESCSIKCIDNSLAI